MDRSLCEAARHSRDARFDGRFFIAVTSTGVYCRSICPARSARSEHVRYYATAAAAEAAGFRPCLRCRPEASPGTPAWLGTSALVSRALRLIGDGALDDDGVDALAERLGVTSRHLRRLFVQHLGATPLEVAATRRLHFAKKLVDETALPFEQVAYAAGYGSVRRFNTEIRRIYDRTPTQLRRLAGGRARNDGERYRFRLAYRPPYDWDATLAALRASAVAGVEHVEGAAYHRAITLADHTGELAVRPADGCAIELEIRFADPRQLLAIVERVRRIFDLGADPAAIGAALDGDPVLHARLARHPGIRVPGAWAPHEHASAPSVGVLRALGEPDAFPTDDPTLRRATGDRTARALERRAQAWRPWRAYAAMLLWSAP